MFRMDPGQNRWQLGFKEAVLSSFDFLSQYKLRPVLEDVTLVRYESDTTFINIYHGRGSFEIGIEVGRLDRPETYPLDYMVSWAGKEAWESEGFGRGTMFQVSTREGVQNIVPKVAELVKKYGDPFLTGNLSFYAELENANHRASVAYERKQMLTRIRKDADAAWIAKDFARVAELLQSVYSDLTAVETKRLAYAEKHVSAGAHSPNQGRS